MNTPIKEISKNQNRITHKSGLVMKLIKTDLGKGTDCRFCDYRKSDICHLIPCVQGHFKVFKSTKSTTK